MPWLIKTADGGMRSEKRFFSRLQAEQFAQEGDEIVADLMRAGTDYPCALHKGPAGDCNPWNCRSVAAAHQTENDDDQAYEFPGAQAPTSARCA